MLQRPPQANLVQMAGQFVEAREPLESRFVLLAGIDETKAANHTAGRSAPGALSTPAVVDPAETAVVAAQAILAVILLTLGEMIGQRLQARRRILRIDAVGEALTGGDS